MAINLTLNGLDSDGNVLNDPLPWRIDIKHTFNQSTNVWVMESFIYFDYPNLENLIEGGSLSRLEKRYVGTTGQFTSKGTYVEVYNGQSKGFNMTVKHTMTYSDITDDGFNVVESLDYFDGVTISDYETLSFKKL